MASTDPSGGFKTNDLYFAAYLQVAGVQMTTTERDHKNRVLFVFDDSIANIPELKKAWFNHNGKVPALPYAHAIKSLKSICHMG